MKPQIEQLLQQKMDRKQFLKNVGAGMIAMVGLGVIVKAFQPAEQTKKSQVSSGYGASTYGGAPAAQASQPRRLG